jgi:ribosomal protein L11 methyltransferase
MTNTIKISIAVNDNLIREELIARLSVINYNAFEEKEDELDAFVDEGKFDAAALESILKDYKLEYTKSFIAKQNWNALWESNFQPVAVDDFCIIRAEFHEPVAEIKNEIIITPKMSFGTGHHATTYMMISEMRQIDFKEKQVADFGTGTGVLAVLAEKLGARYVSAIDNDDWSIENSKENIERNHCKNIKIEKAEGFNASQKFDVILANINKNIIMQNALNLASGIEKEGKLLLSGLLKDDENDIVSAFKQKGLDHISTIERNNWICILMGKD